MSQKKDSTKGRKMYPTNNYMATYSPHILYPEILIPIVYSVYITAGNFHIFLSIVIFAHTAGIMKGGATHFPPFLHEALVKPT